MSQVYSKKFIDVPALLVLQLRQSWLDLGYGALPESSEDRSSSNL